MVPSETVPTLVGSESRKTKVPTVGAGETFGSATVGSDVTSLFPVRRIMNDGRREYFPDKLAVCRFSPGLCGSEWSAGSSSQRQPGNSSSGWAGRRRRPRSPTRSRTLPAWPRLCDQVKRALGPPASQPPRPPKDRSFLRRSIGLRMWGKGGKDKGVVSSS